MRERFMIILFLPGEAKLKQSDFRQSRNSRLKNTRKISRNCKIEIFPTLVYFFVSYNLLNMLCQATTVQQSKELTLFMPKVPPLLTLMLVHFWHYLLPPLLLLLQHALCHQCHRSVTVVGGRQKRPQQRQRVVVVQHWCRCWCCWCRRFSLFLRRWKREKWRQRQWR